MYPPYFMGQVWGKRNSPNTFHRAGVVVNYMISGLFLGVEIPIWSLHTHSHSGMLLSLPKV